VYFLKAFALCDLAEEEIKIIKEAINGIQTRGDSTRYGIGR